MTRIQSLSLYVPNPGQLAEWYRSLGFDVRKRGMVYHISIGYSDLKLIQGDQEAWFHFAFHVREPEFDQYVEDLQQKIDLLPANPDGSFVRKFPSWQAHSVYAHDPCGNIVEWITRPGHSWSDLPIPIPAVTGIAEIGIPVADVGAYHHRTSLFLPDWKPGSEEFAIIGGTEGLILLVKEGRGWLPTGRPAKFFPCSAVLSHEGQRVSFHTVEGKITWSR